MDFQNDIQQCLKVLRRGGIILYPTDTIWGLGCDATDEAAIERIYELKQRPGEKAMIILLADEKDILNYIADPDPAVFDYLEELDKPTTIIYDNAIQLPDSLIAGDGSIAIRIVKDEFCRQLIHRLKKPLVSTSANLSGQNAPATFKDISDEIKNAVDYVVQHRREDNDPGRSSSIVRWNKNGGITVIRP